MQNYNKQQGKAKIFCSKNKRQLVIENFRKILITPKFAKTKSQQKFLIFSRVVGNKLAHESKLKQTLEEQTKKFYKFFYFFFVFLQ